MSRLVESLRRLYKSGRKSAEDIEALCEKGTISAEERDYILAE